MDKMDTAKFFNNDFNYVIENVLELQVAPRKLQNRLNMNIN